MDTIELESKAEKYSDSVKSRTLCEDFIYVAAIDLGTIYSGYAYAHRDDVDFKNKKIEIAWQQLWNSGNIYLSSLKAPTCVFLDKDGELICFGFDAENKFANYIENRKMNDYYFFRRFKMTLYNKDITPDLVLEDETEKKLPAVTVFSQTIFALKRAFLDNMKKQGINLEIRNVRWVLTVPAIWSDAAKQFMRTCANKAGIPNEQLLIALEPEAASIYCQYVKTKGICDDHLTVSKPGTKYVVVDLGGGTADITVHEILSDGHLREIHCATGDDCGGNSINESLLGEIVRSFGAPLVNSVKKEHPEVYFEIHRNFEAVKRIFNPESEEDMSLNIPYVFVNAMCKKMSNESLFKTLEIGPSGSDVKLKNGKVMISSKLAKEKLYDPTKVRTIALLKAILSNLNDPGLTKLLLVGGFSESEYIQKAIRLEFPDKEIILPRQAGLCVVQGAVLFGFCPELISHRVVRYTYGLNVSPVFDKSIHDEKRKYIVDGKERCKNVFFSYAKAGTAVYLNQHIMKVLWTISRFQESLDLSMYVSTSENPKYVDERGCNLIGKLIVKIPNPSEEYRDVEVTLVFGNTELQIKAKDVTSGNKCETSLDFVFY